MLPILFSMELNIYQCQIVCYRLDFYFMNRTLFTESYSNSYELRRNRGRDVLKSYHQRFLLHQFDTSDGN